MQTKRLRTILVAGIAAGSLFALSACERGIDDQETVEAEEIAEGEGIAERGATPDEDRAELRAELILEGDEDLFDEYDGDSNVLLDRDEFEDMDDKANIFGVFDVNEDRKLGEEEFYGVMFERWDTDDSGLVGPVEYLDGAIKWFPGDTEELENFADIDANDDGLLSKGEFVANMDDVALFDQWDLDDDAEIAREELRSVLTQIWDVDSNKNISRDEWGGPAYDSNTVVAGIAVAPTYIDHPQASWNTRTEADAKDAPKTNERTRVGTVISGRATVGDVVSDRGFWLQGKNGKVFAIVREDIPKDEMIDINEGAELELTGIVLGPKQTDAVGGTLDEKTREIISGEPAFISIYHAEIEIL